MDRAQQIIQRRKELHEHLIPAKTAELQALVAEYDELGGELERIHRRRHLRVIDGGLPALIGALGAALLRQPRRLALAASSTAVVGVTVVAVTFAAPAELHPSATPAAPAVVYVPTDAAGTVPAGPSRPVSPSVGVSASPSAPAPSQTPSTAPAAPVAASSSAPEPSASPSSPAPSLPVPLPSVTVSVSVPVTIDPSPSASCLIGVDLPPVVGACVL